MSSNTAVAVLALLLALPASAQEAGKAAPDTTPAPPMVILPPADAPLVTLRLKDGQTLRGRILSRDSNGVLLDLGGGARITVPAGQFEEVTEQPGKPASVSGPAREPEPPAPGAGGRFSLDPNRTRYLYSPSGFMLRAGEVYFSQTELFYSSVTAGVTDHITLSLGSAIPALFAKDGLNLVVAAKVGASPSDYIHLALGAQAFLIPGAGSSGGSFGFLFGTVTVGTPDAHFGVSVGPPFVASGNGSALGSVLVSVSGNLRVAPALALVTENWFVPNATFDSAKGLQMVNALAARIIGDHIAVDLGLIHVPGASVPIPWIDFTYNFH